MSIVHNNWPMLAKSLLTCIVLKIELKSLKIKCLRAQSRTFLQRFDGSCSRVYSCKQTHFRFNINMDSLVHILRAFQFFDRFICLNQILTQTDKPINVELENQPLESVTIFRVLKILTG